MKLTANAETAQALVNYPKGLYDAEVKGASVDYTKDTGATMIIIDWKPLRCTDPNGPDPQLVLDNPSRCRLWVMVDGLSKKGELLSTNNYFDVLDALRVKRDYLCCGTMASTRPFVVEKKDGKYYCPHCGKIGKVDIDVNEDKTVPWAGLKARIALSIGKMEGSEEERNRVGRVTAIPQQ